MASKQANKINPERQRQRFSREFKLEAVRQLERGQKPATQLALELGVARNRLYKWQAQLREGKPLHAGPGRPKLAEESEVSRLRRELKRLREERDILKKARAYFAKRRG
ncbi:MAG: IS3 family transposase [Gammaproteobacteria bacterium]|nr:MAG: IS3 family transposase [Gammaproteobacteria bacterium]